MAAEFSFGVTRAFPSRRAHELRFGRAPVRRSGGGRRFRLRRMPSAPRSRSRRRSKRSGIKTAVVFQPEPRETRLGWSDMVRAVPGEETRHKAFACVPRRGFHAGRLPPVDCCARGARRLADSNGGLGSSSNPVRWVAESDKPIRAVRADGWNGSLGMTSTVVLFESSSASPLEARRVSRVTGVQGRPLLKQAECLQRAVNAEQSGAGALAGQFNDVRSGTAIRRARGAPSADDGSSENERESLR